MTINKKNFLVFVLRNIPHNNKIVFQVMKCTEAWVIFM
ncbi:hypothetical protein SAMN05518672_102682 [Chitinophaga sp. CF118]|nr:hypothetical protein SAMN05518672_102682 [Chitinophaga sp. CF118]